MDKAILVNIAGEALTLENSAYEILSDYLSSLRRYYTLHESREAAQEHLTAAEDNFLQAIKTDQFDHSVTISEGVVLAIIEKLGHPRGEYRYQKATSSTDTDNNEHNSAHSTQIREQMNSAVSATGSILMSVVKIIACIVFVGLIIAQISVCVSFGIAYFSDFHDLADFLIVGNTDAAILAVGLGVLAPLIIITSLVAKLIFKFRFRAFWVWTLTLISISSWVMCGVYAFDEFKARSEYASSTTITNYSLPSNQLEIEIDRNYERWSPWNFAQRPKMKVDIDVIEKNNISDSTIRIEVTRSSRGASQSDARNNAMTIYHHYKVTRNRLELPRYMEIQGDHYLEQECEVDIYVPRGMQVRINGRTDIDMYRD